jgi:hypothetical protein
MSWSNLAPRIPNWVGEVVFKRLLTASKITNAFAFSDWDF